MENIADLLKIFFAIVVFAIALTILFQMTSLAKDTADAVFLAIDRNTYIDYNSYKNDGPNRKVKFTEIIPTIYRYATEGYGVTIIDNKKIVARFDLGTESQVQNCFWTRERYAGVSQQEKDKSDLNKKEILNHLNRYILSKVGASISSEDYLVKLIKEIYSSGDGNPENPVYTSWLNANSFQNNNIAQRVNCDLYGGTTNFSLRNPGINETIKKDIAGSHKAVCNEKGLLAEYQDATFTEYIVQIDKNSYITDENGEKTDLFAYGEIRYTKKREIIYVKN